MSVDRAGRILVGGGVSGTGFTSMALARLLGDGSFDAAFGQQGRVSAGTQQTPASVITFTSNVFELADGDLLAVGSQNNGGFHGGCDTTAVVRLNPDGTPDDAFGADGVQRHQNSCAMVRSAMLGTGDQLTVAGAVFDYTASSSAYSGFGPSGSTFNGELAAKRQGFLTDATLMPNGDVLLAGNVTSDTCAVGTLPQGTLCSAVVLKEIESDGDPESAFGDSGTVSYPSVEPVLDRSRFQLLIAESMPESVRVRHGRLTVQLKCPGAVRSGCTFDLVLRMRHGRLVHLPETEVGAGRAKHLTQDIGSAQTGSHGSLRGEVSSPGQSPVNVNARVTIRG